MLQIRASVEFVVALLLLSACGADALEGLKLTLLLPFATIVPARLEVRNGIRRIRL